MKVWSPEVNVRQREALSGAEAFGCVVKVKREK
jgi:hypothetical protein